MRAGPGSERDVREAKEGGKWRAGVSHACDRHLSVEGEGDGEEARGRNAGGRARRGGGGQVGCRRAGGDRDGPRVGPEEALELRRPAMSGVARGAGRHETVEGMQRRGM